MHSLLLPSSTNLYFPMPLGVSKQPCNRAQFFWHWLEFTSWINSNFRLIKENSCENDSNRRSECTSAQCGRTYLRRHFRRRRWFLTSLIYTFFLIVKFTNVATPDPYPSQLAFLIRNGRKGDCGQSVRRWLIVRLRSQRHWSVPISVAASHNCLNDTWHWDQPSISLTALVPTSLKIIEKGLLEWAGRFYLIFNNSEINID